jgi:hypothetical protein
MLRLDGFIGFPFESLNRLAVARLQGVERPLRRLRPFALVH